MELEARSTAASQTHSSNPNGSSSGGRARLSSLNPAVDAGGGPLTVVMVGGFLLPPTKEYDAVYWGEALNFPQHRILCVHPSPIASLHDRVCQIFYELKGGRVSYGRGHSEKFGHDALGAEYPGSFTEWDADHPIHLIGHSYGGVTIRMLLHYLEKKAFKGYDTSPDWVRSITSINTPHNGTHLVYGLGAHPAHPPIVLWGSPGYLLGTLAHIAEFLDIAWLRAAGVDFGLQYWNLSWRKNGWRAVARLVESLLGLSRVSTSCDNAAYEMTLHAALAYNEMTTTYPGIYYFSFVGTSPRHHAEADKADWVVRLAKGLSYRLMEWHVKTVDFAGHGIFDDYHKIDRWTKDGESDGVVSVWSQAFPRVPTEAPHNMGLPDDISQVVSGQWYVQELPVDHVGIVGYPHSPAFQAQFFKALYGLLQSCQDRDLPSSCASGAGDSPVFAWASLGSTPHEDEVAYTTSIPPAESESLSDAAVEDSDHAHHTHTHAHRHRKAHEPRKKGWLLARQNSVCECQPMQGVDVTLSPSTRMLKCPECTRGLKRHESIVLRGRAAEGNEKGAAALLLLWLVALGVTLYDNPTFIMWSLASALTFRVAITVVRHTLAPTYLSMRARAIWSLSFVGVIHSATAGASALLLLGGWRPDHQDFCRRLMALPPSCMLPAGFALRLLTAQLLLSSGYYAVNLCAQVQHRSQGRHPTSLTSQAIILVLFTLTLRGYVPVDPLGSSYEGTLYVRRLICLALLGEMHTAAVLLRDLLVVGGYLQAAPADAEILQLHVPWKAPPRGRQHGLAAVMWVAIWATFFLCQCFPLLYVLAIFGSRLLLVGLLYIGGRCTMGLWPECTPAEGFAWWMWPVGVLTGVLCVALSSQHLLSMMTRLSEKFQLDFWRTHLSD